VSLKLADIYNEIARMHSSGVAGVVATVVSVGGSTPRDPGAKMIVYEDGRTLGSIGGGAVEAETIRRALRQMGLGEPKLLSFDLDDDAGMACGGSMEIFLEPITAGPSALVIGGGHVGLAVARLAKQSGFRVTVVDDRADMVSSERFPFADTRLNGGPELLDGELAVDGLSFVVVVTRGHRYDKEWVEALAGHDPKYMGMIGSEKKVRATLEELAAAGVAEHVLTSMHAPIGIDIGAETPEEIAVSIVSEMIAVRHGVTDTAMLKDKPEYKGRNRGR
jgi:xanthine dehydrogenase accessory factor